MNVFFGVLGFALIIAGVVMLWLAKSIGPL